MTSALRHSPSQAKREARRFNTLTAQRRRLLLALEAVTKWLWTEIDYQTPGGIGAEVPADIAEARAAIAEVRSCRIVPLEES